MMVLVTGATGFVGSALVRRLALERRSSKVVAAVRRIDIQWPEKIRSVHVGELSLTTDWRAALQGVHVVVHCAARAHIMNDISADPLTEFRRVNVDGTKNLALQAAAEGVKRFIYLSSVKVNGELTVLGKPFAADDEPAPKDPYGLSKYEAELQLHQIASETGMELVIIRPPLVYGPGVKANFQSMMRWLSHGLPLPLAAVTKNRRSLVALDNLVDLIITCLDHTAAANQTFLVSDNEDLSTVSLLRRMGELLGRPACLLYVPNLLLKMLAVVVNRFEIYQRLCGSLELDISKTRQLLGWTPPISVDEGLRRTAQGFGE